MKHNIFNLTTTKTTLALYAKNKDWNPGTPINESQRLRWNLSDDEAYLISAITHLLNRIEDLQKKTFLVEWAEANHFDIRYLGMVQHWEIATKEVQSSRRQYFHGKTILAALQKALEAYTAFKASSEEADGN